MKKYNVIVVFSKDFTKTLMCKRTKEPYKGMYNLVGGKIEKENDGLNEAYRELKEETNLEIDELKLIRILSGKETYREYPNGDKLYDITAIFVIKKYHNEIKINDNESKKLEWFDINDLPENMTVHTKNYLNKFGNILEEALREFEN